MSKKPDLDKLKAELIELKLSFNNIELKIDEIIAKYPYIRIDLKDSINFYKHGFYGTNPSLEFVKKISRKTNNDSEDIIVTLKNGEEILLKDYFSKEEIELLNLKLKPKQQ